MATPPFDPVGFLRNVTGFDAIAQEVDFGSGTIRYVATGAPMLREPTFGVRRLALGLCVNAPWDRSNALRGLIPPLRRSALD